MPTNVSATAPISVEGPQLVPQQKLFRFFQPHMSSSTQKGMTKFLQ